MQTLFTMAAATFEAACRIPVLPDEHPAARLHGHGYVARALVRGAPASAGFSGDEPDALRRELERAIRPLDHRLLNEIVETPTDENLARFVGDRLAPVADLATVGVQSTRHSGADLTTDGTAHVWRRYRFEAAHRLPNVPDGHQCGRMHGHGFEVIVHASVALGDAPMGPDFASLDQAFAPVREQLHRRCLNDIDGLDNPTSELIAQWIWARLESVLPALSWVSVYETHTAGCHYDGARFRIWKERRFEAATTLPQAPQDDARRGLHGHSYLARLHVIAPLDRVLGWTVDYGDVKTLFEPTYCLLDHHRIDALDGLERPGTVALAQWVATRMRARLPSLDRVDLFETPACGAVIAWGDGAPALPAQLR